LAGGISSAPAAALLREAQSEMARWTTQLDLEAAIEEEKAR
jgi:hypothetical protein